MKSIESFLNEKNSLIFKVIGATNETEYNFFIKRIYEVSKKRDNILLIKDIIDIPSDFNLIQQINDSSKSMNLDQIENEEIILTNDAYSSNIVKKGINDILAPYIRNYSFKNENIKRNFFVKEIVWLYNYANKIDWNKYGYTLIYYGSIKEDESVLLKTLNSSGIKVLYINSESDTELLSGTTIKYNYTLPMLKFDKRVVEGQRYEFELTEKWQQESKPILKQSPVQKEVSTSVQSEKINTSANATITPVTELPAYKLMKENRQNEIIEELKQEIHNRVEKIKTMNNSDSTKLNMSEHKSNEIVKETWAKTAKQEIKKKLYDGSGVFIPWAFRQGTTHPIHIDAVMEDIETYWGQESRMRPNFKADDNTVYVPNFIVKINGVYTDKEKEVSLLNTLTSQPFTVFLKEPKNILSYNPNMQDVYSLAFVMNDNFVDFGLLQKNNMYKLSNINIDIQKFICNKFNEFIAEFKNNIKTKDILLLLAKIINMPIKIVNIIENFDFPFKVPKLVVYSSSRNKLDFTDILFIHYLNMIGIDIVLINTLGAVMIEDDMFSHYITTLNLDEMIKMSYDAINTTIISKINEKKSFFNRIFKK